MSDERLKKNIRPFELGLNQVLGIQPKTYRYNGLGGTEEDHEDRIGVIAQELEKVAPELIEKRMAKLNKNDKKETEFKAVNYNAFTYMVINAMKEFYHKWFDDSTAIHRELSSVKSENERLKEENALKSKEIEAVKARLDKIEKKLNSK
ncbi:MAG: tail fiber domain-containing protein [Bacteriovorax sp.]|nr:tail fiber domain-containing protein [Bacteriovorax sp.]